jgi:hypothetical protein
METKTPYETLDPLADVVREADRVLYDAVGTAEEAAALATYKEAKAAFRAAEAPFVGTTYSDTCHRCGGPGGWEGWPGWTCFECSGTGRVDRTYRKHRFEADPRTRVKREEKNRAERAERDEVFEAKLVELGAVGEALRAAREIEREWIATEDWENEPSREIRFRATLAEKLHRFGSLSPAQIAAVEKGLARDAERTAAAKVTEAAGPLVAGRQTIEGEVVSKKFYESDRFGGTTKILVVLDDGRKVFGGVPSALYGVSKGDRVRFDAAIETTADPAFGYYSRPTKAEFISQVAAKEESR